VTSDPLRSPLPGDPEAVHRWLEGSNPELYRQLALYLQVLREVLAPSVDQACFYLATQQHPSRYAALPQQRRQELHRRLSELVHRCASLLTVEQLATLAAQIASERQRQRREHQRTLLQRLTGETTAGSPPGSLEPGTSPEATDPDGLNHGPGPLPPGSVQLGLDLPLRGDLLGWAQVAPTSFQDDSHGADRFDPDGLDPSDSDLEAPFDDELAAGLASGLLGDLDLDLDLILDPGDPLQSSEQGAHFNEAEPRFFAEPDQDSESSGPHRTEDHPDPAPGFLSSGSDAAVVPWSFLNAAGSAGGFTLGGPDLEPPQDNAGASLAADPDPWGHPKPAEGLLPRNPLALQAWLEGYDRALARRLRNLSHALNVELLRSGLISALLPTSLLDAVLDGQIDPQGAPPNLLQLQLPMPMPGLESPLQATVLLLRCGDLELEQPRLRTVRRELQRRRQEGRRMAQHYRRLKRRLQGREAEALWLQDIRTRQQGPAPSPNQP